MDIVSQLKRCVPERIRGRLRGLRERLGPEPRETLLRTLPKHSVGAEIGVWKGDFSARILEIVEPRELHLIDPWKFENEDEYRCALYGADGAGSQSAMDRIYADVVARFSAERSVRIHRMKSSDVTLPDNHLDWVYIDGNHLYEFVKADIALFSRKLKPGGFLAGDDYSENLWWRDGVKRAVDEAAASGPLILHKIRGTQYMFRKVG